MACQTLQLTTKTCPALPITEDRNIWRTEASECVLWRAGAVLLMIILLCPAFKIVCTDCSCSKNIFMFCLFINAKGAWLLQLFPRYVTVIYCDINFKCKCVDIFEYKGLLYSESHRRSYKHSWVSFSHWNLVSLLQLQSPRDLSCPSFSVSKPHGEPRTHLWMWSWDAVPLCPASFDTACAASMPRSIKWECHLFITTKGRLVLSFNSRCLQRQKLIYVTCVISRLEAVCSCVFIRNSCLSASVKGF